VCPPARTGIGRAVPTREDVTELLSAGHSYATAARELGIAPGLAYMIATGLPADGSGAPPPVDEARLEGGTSQQLVNPPAADPVRKAHVLDWVRGRAERELTRSP